MLVEEDLEDKEVENYRVSKCKPCPFNNGLLCTSCGCILAIKQKAKTNLDIATQTIQITHCYEGYWNDEGLAKFYGHLE